MARDVIQAVFGMVGLLAVGACETVLPSREAPDSAGPALFNQSDPCQAQGKKGSEAYDQCVGLIRQRGDICLAEGMPGSYEYNHCVELFRKLREQG